MKMSGARCLTPEKVKKEGAAENFTAPTFVGRGNNFIGGAENVGYSRRRISTRRFN
jgi:hypothetical protein